MFIYFYDSPYVIESCNDKTPVEIFYLSYEEAETLLHIVHSKKGIVYMLSKSLPSLLYAWL